MENLISPMAHASSSEIDQQLQSLLTDIGKMDLDEKRALEKALDLQRHNQASAYVENVAAEILHKLEGNRLKVNDSRMVQTQIYGVLHDPLHQEQQTTQEFKPVEKARSPTLFTIHYIITI